MSFDFSKEINNGEIDEILAKAQEESLRYFNEVELPRLQRDGNAPEKDEKDILSSQVGGKAGSLLYQGADASGFHLDAGKTYIYPTNYPVRQYQATMVKTALFKNTLVSLPTGLGKTFIAAVVMYNFYRWYPNGKVVFMAPTRPLVAQQTKACHNIMNIPVEHTAELTGLQNAEQRAIFWKEKRVFYLTPQVMVNDLKSKTCPANLIKCIVIDEAHRATKDYAYCQVLNLLSEESDTLYRVLGLSATPGSDINAVQQVVRNLGISALEMRSEDSLDVAPYTHSRSVDTIVVDLSANILRVKEDLLQIFEKYAKRLKDFKALSYNIATVSKFQILKACEKFRNNPPRGVPPAIIGNLISDFTVCMSLAHSLELLQIYGLRAFYTYLSDDHSDKHKSAASRLKNDEDLKEMLKRLHLCLNPKVKQENSFTWSHPKLKNLVSTLSQHFQKFTSNGGSTKAIVFCQYRVVVSEIVELLSKLKPLIKATEFIGQSGGKEKGMPQAKQLQIMKDFRNGIINCLVATCVAEEGLDIGEVDLIVLMEAHKSPVRLVQRIGRTGRKRKGYCVVLLTKGREEQKFHEAMATRKSYVETIVNSPAVKASLCPDSPRMIPFQFTPIQQLVHINPTDLVSPARPQIKKQADIRKCFTAPDSPFVADDELLKVVEELGQPKLTFERLPKHEEMWHRRFDKKISIDELLSKISSMLSEWNEWNHEMQETYHVDHTSNSKLLCHLLKISSKEIDFPDLESIVNSDKEAATNSSQRSDSKDSGLGYEKSPNKRKKMKKDHVKKNMGMDIRDCIVAAKSGKTKKQIIDIISDDDDNIVDVRDNTNHCTSPCNNDNIVEHNEDILFFPYMKEQNIFEKFIPLINHSKTWACERKLPKLETFFGGITIQIVENLKFGDVTQSKQENPIVCEVIPEEEIPTEFVEIDDLFDSESDNDDFFANSCLNTAVTEFHDNISTLGKVGNINNQQSESANKLCFSKNNESVSGIKMESKPVVSNNLENPMILNSPSLSTAFNIIEDNEKSFNWSRLNTPPCAKNSNYSSPIDKSKSNIITITDIMTHTPPCARNSNHSSPIDKSKSNIITITDIMTQRGSHISKGATPPGKLKTPFIVASTPNLSVKNFRKSQFVARSSQSQAIGNGFNTEMGTDCGSISPVSEASEMWNLSDLFEEDERDQDKENKQIKDDENLRKSRVFNVNGSFHFDKNIDQNSTMLGITQMVSLIEKEKGHQKLNDINEEAKNNKEIQNNRDEAENKNDLSDILDCDAEIFTQVDIESIMPKDDAIRECSTKTNDFTSKCSEVSKSVYSSETKCLKNLISIGTTNINKQHPHSSSVNFKKFTAKKTLFPRGNTHNNVDTGSFNTVKNNKSYSESFLLECKKDVHFNNVKHQNPLKLQKTSESMKLSDKYFINENENDETSCSTTRLKPDETSLKINTVRNFVAEEEIDKKPNRELEQSSTTEIISLEKTSKRIKKEVDNDVNCKTSNVRLNNPIWSLDSDDSDDVFETPSLEKKEIPKHKKEGLLKKKKIKNKHKESNEFIEKEAEVSGTLSSADDSDGSSLDDIDNSFINDNTEYISNDTQAIYLKSVKSPLNKGNFKIPANRTFHQDVFSQQVEEDSEYINDSFCVDSEEEDEESLNSMSLLEIAERKLASNKNTPKKKRRRIMNSSQHDSSPEKTVVPMLAMSQPSPVQSNKSKGKRKILSDSESEESPLRKKHFISKSVNKVTCSDNILQNKNQVKISPGRSKIDNLIIDLSNDETECKIIEEKEKTIDLTLDSSDDSDDSVFERKFQEDLKEALKRSQSEFSQNISSENSITSTPKSNLNTKKFEKSVRIISQQFNERLNKIKSRFCLPDESLDN